MRDKEISLEELKRTYANINNGCTRKCTYLPDGFEKMKIDSTRTQLSEQIQKVSEQNNRAVKAAEQIGAVNADSVSISSQALDLQTAKNVQAELDAERAQRVADIKAQVESGEYSVSTEAVASSFLRAVRG